MPQKIRPQDTKYIGICCDGCGRIADDFKIKSISELRDKLKREEWAVSVKDKLDFCPECSKTLTRPRRS
jgi:hypothetical protein